MSTTIIICLFFVELTVSIFISLTSYWFLKSILPFSDVSVAAVVSTPTALWFVNATLRAIIKLQNGATESGLREEMSYGFDPQIMEFGSKMNKTPSCNCRACVVDEAKQYEDNGSPFAIPKPSNIVTMSKNLIRNSTMDCRGHASNISISIFAICSTVFLRCAVRLFALLHSINRTLRMKRQTFKSNGPFPSFFDVPFRVGRNMSLMGSPFFVFPFLDGWLDRNEVDFHADEVHMLEAVSLDQITINSSHIIAEKLGAQGEASSSQRSLRLGLALGDIIFRVTIHLKRIKTLEQTTPNQESTWNSAVRSITITIRVQSVEFGFFPSLNQIKASGIQINVQVAFNPDASPLPRPESVGMTIECNQMSEQGFCTKGNNFCDGSLLKSKEQIKVVSWDGLQSSFYLRESNDCSSQCDGNDPTTKVVSLISFPAGNVIISAPTRQSQNNSFSQRQASIILGSTLNKPRDSLEFCRNRFAVGLNLEVMPTFFFAINCFLRDVSSCLSANSVRMGENKHSDMKKMAKSGIDVIELDASFCSCIYLPCIADTEALYLWSSSASFHWRKTVQTRSDGSLSDAPILIDQEPDHVFSPLYMAMLTNVHLQSYDGSFVDIILLEGMNAKLINSPANKSPVSCDKVKNDHDCGMKCALTEICRLVARVNEKDFKRIAQITTAMKKTTCSANQMKYSAKMLKTSLFSKRESLPISTFVKRRTSQQTFNVMKLYLTHVDIVVELHPPSEDNDDSTLDDQRIRIAVLQRRTVVQLKYDESKKDAQRDCESEIDLPMPDMLFDSQLLHSDCVCVTEANIFRLEVSVTFYPHNSLPVASKKAMEKTCSTFYGQFNGSSFKLASPSKSQMVCGTVHELRAYELMGNPTSNSLLSIPVHEFSTCGKGYAGQSAHWPMLQTYQLDYDICDTVELLVGTGKFCRVEKIDAKLGEKLELISIQCTKGPSDLQLYWSSVFQWLQASCNDRIQRCIAYLKSSLSNKSWTQGEYLSHKTRIRIVVNSNTSAAVHTSLGVKTVMHTLIENGMNMNISTTKHKISTASTGKKGLKPNILFEVGRISVMLNNTKSPTFVFGGLVLKNVTRQSTNDEISEYVKKKGRAFTDFDRELVTDHEGHPVKEIFDMKLASCTAKFHPDLLFGEVLDDFLLTPRTLDIGLDCLKRNLVKRAKKYQLMSIQVTFSFVDVSLMDYASLAGSSTRDELLLQDVARAYFESFDVAIERNTPPEVIQSQISVLDEDKTSVYSYGPTIQGGDMHLNIHHLVATLIPLNLTSPLVCVNRFDMAGSLFLSGLSPDTPGIGEGRKSDVLILCHHGFMPSGGFSERECGCCYGISFPSNGIPVKLYVDCTVHCVELDASYGQVMKSSIPQLMECIQRLLPPPQNSDNPSVPAKPNPLTWWDNVRFFVHGKTYISADALTVRWLLDTQYVFDQSILLTCKTFSINHCRGHFGIDAKELNVSTPGASYDMSVHPSRKRAQKVSYFPHEVECTDREDRHPLIYVPSIAVKISFSWKTCLDSLLSSNDHHSNGHHSPYVENQSVGNPIKSQDKFKFFRSDGIAVTFDFKASGTELIGNWIVLRIDVLPWFTHINSIATTTNTKDDQRSESFPRLRAVSINVCVHELQVATWFTGEKDIVDWDVEDVEGVCLTVKSVRYTAFGSDQDLIIEGPVRAALLDVSDFIESLECHEKEDEHIKEIERLGQNFGADTEDDSFSSVKVSVSDNNSTATPFFKLQELTSNINELDYVVNAGQIDIHNKSLKSILEGTRTPDGGEERFEGVDKTTWSILVSQLKILWTLDIRDNLMALTQDLLFTIGFMKSQLRQSQLLAEQAATTSLDDNHQSISLFNVADEGVEMTLTSPNPTEDDVEKESRLEYLLQRDISFDLEIDRNGSCDYGSMTQHSIHSEERESLSENPTIPTIDIHFSNPQIQLHNKRTAGSIILAMEGAHVEGRKFVHFLVDGRKVSGKITPSDLTRRTEHLYTLTNMQAYSLNTRVDVTAGLPWLEVCDPGVHFAGANADNLEERFGIAGKRNFQSDEREQMRGDSDIPLQDEQRQSYPPHLRHHEPLAFLKTGLLCEILDQFTFKSRQLFHRPPIHYSTEELIGFIEQGLVSKQDDAVVDEVELKIDSLHFKLDSYQFKTTIDIIRNVLLEPPKPRRHRNVDGEESDPQTPSNRVSSVAAMEMEEVLASDSNYRGKQGREKLRSAAMNLLRDLEDRHALSGASITRRISYRLKKLKWCIQSPDSVDNIEITFTGFFGLHDYSADGCVSSQFGLEDVRVLSSKPGPDSICFTDPTSVVKPVLDERSPCQICGKRFDHSQNDLHSCSFHAGKFRYGIWSCCESTNEHAPGCKHGPHSGKERAATARVETLPRIIDGITLYSHFEVNIFPEIHHALIVQISKSLSKLFMTYFFIGDDDNIDADAVSTITDATGSTEAFSTHPDYTPRHKAVLFGGRGSTRESFHAVDDASELDTEVDSQDEIVFIKVWRVGHLNIEVSFGGFRRLPQRTIDICVPAYSRAYKIGSWAYLGQKYLTYLIHEVLKSGASSALFRRKLTGGASDLQKDPTETLIPKPAASFESKDLPSHDTFIGRHLRRPMGAEAILGTPSRQLTKPKMKVSFAKK
eukprot:CCRYP_001753-RD/>CCRYP_001753-RD protein AED:0.03 eAED:0.03 QI:226/1/1/1/1/1/7/24/2613